MIEHSRILSPEQELAWLSEPRDHLALAWAAGFFDGEGSVGIASARPNGRRAALLVQLGQSYSDEELWRFKEAVGGLGTITGPYLKPSTGLVNRWFYKAQGKTAVKVMLLIAPYLSSRKRTRFEQARTEVGQ